MCYGSPPWVRPLIILGRCGVQDSRSSLLGAESSMKRRLIPIYNLYTMSFYIASLVTVPMHGLPCSPYDSSLQAQRGPRRSRHRRSTAGALTFEFRRRHKLTWGPQEMVKYEINKFPGKAEDSGSILRGRELSNTDCRL